jgi:hypothetical protein
LDGSLSYNGHRLLRKESLVIGNKYIRECQELGNHVVSNNFVEKVMVENLNLFLMYIEPDRAEVALFQSAEKHIRIYQRSAAGIY